MSHLLQALGIAQRLGEFALAEGVVAELGELDGSQPQELGGGAGVGPAAHRGRDPRADDRDLV